MKNCYKIIIPVLFFGCYLQVLTGQNPLFIPDTISGENIHLTLRRGTFEFFPGHITNTMGANGDILGPTIILQKGQQVTLQVKNELNEHTTIHWHGLHVAPENDGGPHTIIHHGMTWRPSFTVLDKASTYWYHPHLHHKTHEHVHMGIAGMLIIRDDEEAELTLPRTYGIDDFPLIVQTKDLNDQYQIVKYSHSDDILMVNATIDPVLEVPAQVVRLRLLNGASERTFNFGLSNGQPFYQIGSDGGLLSRTYQTDRILLSPGERAEVLLDLSGMESQSISLMGYASELPNGIHGAAFPGTSPEMDLIGYEPNPLNGADFEILKLEIINQIPNAVTSIPEQLVRVTPFAEEDADLSRRLVFTATELNENQLNGHFFFNNVPFNMEEINFTIPLDNLEIWELRNNTAIAHPFHIHMVQFYILDRNGVPPPPHEQGRKDVVLVWPDETVRFITRFETFANPEVPYMYHCHKLTHEDAGMMGQFIVFDETSTGVHEKGMAQNVKVFPNPSSGNVHIEFADNNIPNRINLIDLQGNVKWKTESVSNSLDINAGVQKAGTYILQFIYADEIRYTKIIIH